MVVVGVEMMRINLVRTQTMGNIGTAAGGGIDVQQAAGAAAAASVGNFDFFWMARHHQGPWLGGKSELLPAQNVYVEELVKIVPGISSHTHHIIFTI